MSEDQGIPEYPDDADIPSGADGIEWVIKTASDIKALGNEKFKQVYLYPLAHSADILRPLQRESTAMLEHSQRRLFSPNSLFAQGDSKAAARLYSQALRYLDPTIFETEEGPPPETDLERMATACCPLMLNRCAWPCRATTPLRPGLMYATLTVLKG